MDTREVSIAVVDCALGNLQSILNAFAQVGVEAFVTSDPGRIEAAHAVVLPGVGAFGDAMRTLGEHDLVDVLRGVAGSGKPLIGICLGMQLLLSESEEFGRHEGLGIVPGRVRRFPAPHRSRDGLFDAGQKVPQVGWNRISPPPSTTADIHWKDSPLEGVEPDTYMYFMHSYFTDPEEPGVALCKTRYAGVEYCSSLRAGNVVAFQFHPERSAEQGLVIYRNLVKMVQRHCSNSNSG
jgi:glutamine amidotransferase